VRFRVPDWLRGKLAEFIRQVPFRSDVYKVESRRELISSLEGVVGGYYATLSVAGLCDVE
jgi:hypothetical protein